MKNIFLTGIKLRNNLLTVPGKIESVQLKNYNKLYTFTHTNITHILTK